MKWKWPLVWRSRLDAADADRARLRGERDQFLDDRNAAQAAARTAARQFAEADTATVRLAGRNQELQRRLDAVTGDGSVLGDAGRKAIAAWEQRIAEHADWKPGSDDAPLFGGGLPRPTHPALVLHRALERCRQLEARLAQAEGRKGVTGS